VSLFIFTKIHLKRIGMNDIIDLVAPKVAVQTEEQLSGACRKTVDSVALEGKSILVGEDLKGIPVDNDNL
jgi:hypothetical protein